MYLLKIKPIAIQRHTALITLAVLWALSVVCNVGCGDSATITQETPTEAPACDNGVSDGDEADVDCGGSCETACVVGKACAENDDCDSSRCVESLCVCAEGSEVQDGLCVNSTTCADNPCGENATCAEGESSFTFFCEDMQVDSDSPMTTRWIDRASGILRLSFVRPDFAPKNPARFSGLLHSSLPLPDSGSRWVELSLPWPKGVFPDE